VTKRTSLI
jgi:hypothetical protein